jgi:hypothetical protein
MDHHHTSIEEVLALSGLCFFPHWMRCRSKKVQGCKFLVHCILLGSEYVNMVKEISLYHRVIKEMHL